MSESARVRFNPPPGWPKPPAGWVPPRGWKPDPSWPAAPAGWQLWVDAEVEPTPVLRPAEAKATSPASAAPTLSGDQRLSYLEAENAALRAQLAELVASPGATVILDDERVLQEAGVYRYHHPLENAVAYRERLNDLANRIAEMVKAGTAIQSSSKFTFDGSLAKGQAMTRDLARLMLRAYNAEAENVVRTLRLGNAVTAEKRLDAARTAIAKLGAMMELAISEDYHAVRIQEIQLTADYLGKKEEEREAARAERERLREERKVEMELAAAKERLEKERQHLTNVLEKLNASGETDPTLQAKLAQVDADLAQNAARAANIRAGYVYVISNRGAFGERVVKIGLTRRLDPQDRIDELSDASVPFRFDVHALYFSEDAVTLESELHRHFTEQRVNWVNDRKEFFFAAPAEVQTVLAAKVGNLLEFAEEAASTEYLQSVQNWLIHPSAPGASTAR